MGPPAGNTGASLQIQPLGIHQWNYRAVKLIM